MNKNSKDYRKKELKINAIEITSEHLTGSAGLALSLIHWRRSFYSGIVGILVIFPW